MTLPVIDRDAALARDALLAEEGIAHESHDSNGHEGNGDRRSIAETLRSHLENGQALEDRRALAIFCFEEPDGFIGQFVGKLAVALAKRQVPVHLYSRHVFLLEAPGLKLHPLGDSPQGDILTQVQEFARRACNAFSGHFPAGVTNVTLLGHEWSSVPILSILHGTRNLDTLLSLHSLEQQRSDMSSELSQQIAEIERSGMNEAKTVLLHDPTTGDVARRWAPAIADRLVPARRMFPMHQFESDLDPGEVKARYQVGPVDPTILYVGDMHENYGPDILVKSMPTILRNHPQARLILVGDGPLCWPMRVYSRYLLLDYAVRVPGHIGDQALFELIQAADIVAVPSRGATPWWPILAAWAARRPVVATHEAAEGLLVHGADSVLIYPNEPSCVWGIERLLFDPDLAASLAERGNEKLQERFGHNSLAAQIEELMGVQTLNAKS